MPGVSRPSARHARVTITAIFFLNGATFAAWYARLPAIQDDLGLSPGAIGLALLGAPLGLLLAQPAAGALIARRGSRAIVALAPLSLVLVVLPALAVSLPTLLLATVGVGAANGVLDIAMNAQGLTVERRAERPLFSSLHAAFSFGALAGATVAALVAGAGIEPVPHLLVAGAVAAVAAAVLAPGLVADEDTASTEARRFARPSRRLLALGAIAFCALLAEGSVFDWSGIFMTSEADASPGVAPLGLAAFSLAMGVGRLAGDRATERLGAVRLARGGGVLAAAGLGVALLVARPGPAIAGFVVMGLGLATIVPLVFRAAGAGGATAGPALAAVSTPGYTGFLVGPPLIGLLAELVGLRGALVAVCATCGAVVVLAGRVQGQRSPAAGPALRARA